MTIGDVYNICKVDPNRFGCINGKHNCSDPRCYPNCPTCSILPSSETYDKAWFLLFIIPLLIFITLLISLLIYNIYMIKKATKYNENLYNEN